MTMQLQTRRLVRLDPSSCDAWRQCQKKFDLSNLQGLVPLIDNKYLAFGSSFHIARALLRNKKPLEEALAAGLNSYAKANCAKMPPRSMNDLQLAIEEWNKTYMLGGDTLVPIEAPEFGPAIELPFSVQYYQPAEYEIDINLCGVVDELAIDLDSNSNELLIVDAKTTSSANFVEYLDGYRNSPQMMFYAWIVRKVFKLDYYPGVIIDGIFLSKTRGVVCYRNQTPIKYEDYMIDRVMTRTLNIAKRIAQTLGRSEEFDYEFAACEGKYDRCQFADHCMLQGAAQEMFRNTMYRVREYDPAKFNAA